MKSLRRCSKHVAGRWLLRMKVTLFGLGLLVLGSALMGCSDNGAPSGGDPTKQINDKAKPLGKGPHMGMSGGGAKGPSNMQPQ